MFGTSGPAQLIYHVSDFEIVKRGNYVLCAVSGERIPLDALTYWSSEYQEAYRSAIEATAAKLAGGAARMQK